MRKFGLNKSGYLISIVKDQYFYWTDLKKIFFGGEVRTVQTEELLNKQITINTSTFLLKKKT